MFTKREFVPENASPWYSWFCFAQFVPAILMTAIVIAIDNGDSFKQIGPVVGILAVLTIFSDSFTYASPRTRVSVSMTANDVGGITLAALGHPLLGIIAIAIGTPLDDYVMKKKPIATVFHNIGMMVTAQALACLLVVQFDIARRFAGDSPITPIDIGYVLLAVLVVEYYTSLVTAMAIHLSHGVPLREGATADSLYELTVTIAKGLVASVVIYLAWHSPWLLVPIIAAIASYAINGMIALRRGHQATHDPLTALPNRVLLARRAGELISDAVRTNTKVGVIVLDLDGFKTINDTYGHAAGDTVLVEIGSRLQRHVRGDDIVARLGGDEFALAIDSATPERAAEVVNGILSEIARPIIASTNRLSVTGSAGIAFFPDDGDDFEDVMQRADFAMYSAKADRSGMQFYSPTEDRRREGRSKILEELRNGIHSGKLELEFQPLVELRSNRIVGVEALVRWYRDGHLVMPSEFVELAEKSGVISQITSWVLDHTLDAARRAEDEGFNLSWSVNVSARDINNRDFVGIVKDSLIKYGIRAEKLELEITETSLLQPSGRMMNTLQTLSDLGVRLALDDFGTGYGTLSHLRGQPFKTVKIDQSFVANMLHNDHDAAIVQSTIDLAKKLGMKVIAEGVESSEVANRLIEMGCDVAQGFFIRRPAQFGVLLGWLARFEDETGSVSFRIEDATDQ